MLKSTPIPSGESQILLLILSRLRNKRCLAPESLFFFCHPDASFFLSSRCILFLSSLFNLSGESPLMLFTAHALAGLAVRTQGGKKAQPSNCQIDILQFHVVRNGVNSLLAGNVICRRTMQIIGWIFDKLPFSLHRIAMHIV